MPEEIFHKHSPTRLRCRYRSYAEENRSKLDKVRKDLSKERKKHMETEEQYKKSLSQLNAKLQAEKAGSKWREKYGEDMAKQLTEVKMELESVREKVGSKRSAGAQTSESEVFVRTHLKELSDPLPECVLLHFEPISRLGSLKFGLVFQEVGDCGLVLR